jgi:hypothetical protein
MPPEPLRPEEVDALLAPNLRTTVADLLSAPRLPATTVRRELTSC